MAIGQGQGGGLMGVPDVPEIGASSWAELTGMHPSNPLVGGAGNHPDAAYRMVAPAMTATATSAPMPGAERIQGQFSELLNFKHNPMPWLLVAALAYFGLVHLHVAGKLGPYRASGGVGK